MDSISTCTAVCALDSTRLGNTIGRRRPAQTLYKLEVVLKYCIKQEDGAVYSLQTYSSVSC